MTDTNRRIDSAKLRQDIENHYAAMEGATRRAELIDDVYHGLREIVAMFFGAAIVCGWVVDRLWIGAVAFGGAVAIDMMLARVFR